MPRGKKNVTDKSNDVVTDMKNAITKSNYSKKLAELQLYKEQISLLESQVKPLSESIKEYVKKVGTKTDSGGFISDTGDIVVEARSRQKINFSLDLVVSTLINKPELLNKVMKVIPVLDEDAINSLYEAGELTSDEVQKMATVEISHSLYITKKEDIKDEVQQTKVAASNKKKLIPKKR